MVSLQFARPCPQASLNGLGAEGLTGRVGWADFNCLLSGGYNCTWRGDEPCYAVTAVILLFFPVPLAAIKSHNGLLGGLRGAQL